MIVAASDCALTRHVELFGGTLAEARAALLSRAVVAAAEFGARVVRVGPERIILGFHRDGATVITVMAATDRLPRQLIPETWGGPPRFADDPTFLCLGKDHAQ